MGITILKGCIEDMKQLEKVGNLLRIDNKWQVYSHFADWKQLGEVSMSSTKACCDALGAIYVWQKRDIMDVFGCR